ncbi:hypothetical protein VQ03_25490 [Methylobacterium tarhaniae]|uniref:Uncharacterized protein n=1 Tax=Methylobacterium tarhaniae TaxID=1187852 RepID=A0A0J6V2Y1_9HYPH|nr:hypothetical protein VQ03_25490 [Methylobacterium tarhaniae]
MSAATFIPAACSATMKRASAWATMQGRANSAGSVSRAIVAWNEDRVASTSGRNCLGKDSRETGQSRVPEPPQRMIG